MRKTHWAIIAPGNIAENFSLALQGVSSAHLYSVASRNPERAKAFAEKFHYETYADSYEDLLADPKVDAVYIASPHVFHVEQSIQCLQAGKAVLCEKPMSVNADDARRVFEVAKACNRFYMEAVWTRFMPVLAAVRRWIDEGLIGDVQMVQASMGFSVPFNEKHRLYDQKLAGGALLDVGIYPLTFAQWVFQEAPEQITSLAHIGPSGVDERLGITLRYPGAKIATLNAGITSHSNHEAWIFGSKGSIKVPQFWRCQEATLVTANEEKTLYFPHKVNGYEGEIEEVQRCLASGLTESPTMPWAESLAVMGIMDEIRGQIGLTYPMEAP